MRDPTTRRSVARRLVSATFAYAVAFSTPRLLRLVIVPLVVMAVGFRTYGDFVLLTLIIPFVHVVCELGMGTAALRIAPHEPPEKRAAVFTSVIASRFVLVSFAFVVLALARRPIATLLTGSETTANAVLLTAVALVPFTLATAFADQLRSEERHTTLAALSAFREVVESLLLVALVLHLRLGLVGLLLARLLADISITVLMAWTCRHTFRARPSLSTIVILARIGAPFAFLYILYFVRDLDRYLIKTILGVADTGRYELALRIVGPVALSNAALAMVFEPHAFRTYAEPGAGAVIATFLRVYVVAFGGVAFAVAAIAPEVFPLLSPDSSAHAAVIAPSLVFAFVGDGVVRIAGLGADFSKRTRAWIVIAVAHLAVALPATWFLLRTFGIVAAGVALLAGTLVAAEVAYALSRRLFPLDLPVHYAVLVILLGAATSTLLVGGAGVVAPLAIRLAAVPAFVVAACVVTRLRPREAFHVLASARS